MRDTRRASGAIPAACSEARPSAVRGLETGLHQLAAALIVVAASAARAAGPDPAEPTRIHADRIVYDVRGARFEASGGAEIRRGAASIRAASIAFDEVSGRGVAEGDVVIEDGPDTLDAARVELDVHAFEGVIFEGRLRSQATGFHAEGARIEKTGTATYRFRDGRFTTCECPAGERDPWALCVGEAELEVEGYGTARNARFEVLGVPVLWAPWLLFPVKAERQSGLLLPELGVSSRHGMELGLPVFVAAGDPVNLTLTPRWLQKRGAKGDVEIEWVLGRESGGDVFGSFLHDQDVDPNSASEPFGPDRWVVRGREDVFLPAQARFQTDFQFVSDNQYPTDFEQLGRARTQRFLESDAWLGRDFGAAGVFGLVGSADYADDLQNPDNLDRDEFVLQRLPQLDAVLLPAPLPFLPWLVPTLGARYTRYSQLGSAQGQRPTGIVVGDNLFLDTGIDSLPDAQEPGPDGTGGGVDPSMDNFANPAVARGTEGDGMFQEGEPLADEGQRLLLMPRLGAPLRLLDWVELYPELGWYQTLYQSDAQQFAERGLLTGRVDLRTRLRRSFGEGLVHVLEPRIGWAFVSDQGQSSKPLYVPATAAPQRRLRQLDLENLVLDTADRIPEANDLTVGFGNRLYGPGPEGGPRRLLADVAVSAAYQADDGHFGNLYLDGRAHPWARADTWLIVGFDPDAGRLDEALLDLAWRFEPGHRLGLGYRYLRQVGRFFENFPYARQRFKDFDGEFDRVNQITASGRLVLTERWALSYRGGFSFEKSPVLANRGGIEYFSRCGCWSAGIQVAQDRVDGVAVALTYSLTGLGRDDVARAARRSREDALGFLDGF